MASGKIDDQGVSLEPGNAPREPRKGIAFRSHDAHGFGQAGRFAINDAPCRFWRMIAWSQAAAAHGQHQRSAQVAPFFQSGGNLLLLVRNQRR